MSNYVLLNAEKHKDLRVINTRSAKLGDQVMSSLTFPFEFRNVQAHYPILFQQDKNGEHNPVALYGFEQGENLFLDDSGWHARYVPAMIRREPFVIGFQNQEQDGVEGEVRVLTIDMEHPRISHTEGENLFQPLGGQTEFLEESANLMEAIYASLDHCRSFIRALQEHELLESANFEISLQDGSKNQLLGFSMLNEDRVQSLPGEVLQSFNEQGFLMPMFMALASMANMDELVQRKNERVLKAAGSA